MAISLVNEPMLMPHLYIQGTKTIKRNVIEGHWSAGVQ